MCAFEYASTKGEDCRANITNPTAYFMQTPTPSPPGGGYIEQEASKDARTNSKCQQIAVLVQCLFSTIEADPAFNRARLLICSVRYQQRPSYRM